ncbi:putative sugar O-methyltransferase [Actinacidiphila paucisporea]|uniref:putative sugar O-methyltransferase n=1 Tax=Actinacidiphila paucisporea TaxID=310782 RepID=UPI0011610C9E|nr:putative sugar O-methyltransferase [Actinacidiphila paucisporea]
MNHYTSRIFLTVRYLVGLFGLTLTRTSTELSSFRIHAGHGRHDDSRPLPDGTAAVLDDRNPDLEALRARYRRLDSPFRPGRFWRRSRRLRDLNLKYFRGDNAYVWQLRQLGDNARLKFFLLARYVSSLDTHKLLERTGEDGAFGCWTFDFQELPTVSRDLLDSMNEIYFLDHHWGLLSRTEATVVDIGAGYGRLAHRMVDCVPGLTRYLCVDAIPESTFLSEHYLRHRNVDHKATVLRLDEMEDRLAAERPDLAVNIHSFSEMPLSAIEAWIGLLARIGVPALMIVPNEGDRLLSLEDDYLRVDFTPVLERNGYVLAAREPTVADPDVRDLVGVGDWFMLFTRGGGDTTSGAS